MYLALLSEDVDEYDSNLELALRHTIDNVRTIAHLCHAQLLKDIGYLPPSIVVGHLVQLSGELNNRP